MNTKKAQWLKKPVKFESVSLHSLSFLNGEQSSVFFTIGECDNITLSYEKEDSVSVSFVFFHTPNDYIVFKEDRIESLFFGLKSKHNMFNSINKLEINKLYDTITFSSNGKFLLKINNPAFLSSASFGLKMENQGRVKINVF